MTEDLLLSNWTNQSTSRMWRRWKNDFQWNRSVKFSLNGLKSFEESTEGDEKG